MVSDSKPTAAAFDWRRITNWAGLAVLAIVVLLFLATALPQLVGADHSYVVQSGSMSPSIGAGSVVFVSDAPASQISAGDVITFEQRGERGTTRVTHRVVEVVVRDGERQFRTKGDANEDPDPGLIDGEQVVGVVQFHVPLIGHVVAFVQSGTGLLLLVVVPAVLLAVLEARDLLKGGDDPEREGK